MALAFPANLFLGGPATYVMVSGSQHEAHLGQRRPGPGAPREGRHTAAGDIVVFRVPQGEPGEGATVIHRIVGGSPDEGFVMQGDNKDGPDSWQPTGEMTL